MFSAKIPPVDEDKSKDAFFVQLAEIAEAMIASHGKDFAMGSLVLAARFIAEGKPLIKRDGARAYEIVVARKSVAPTHYAERTFIEPKVPFRPTIAESLIATPGLCRVSRSTPRFETQRSLI